MPVDGISFAQGIVEVNGSQSGSFSGATFNGTTTFSGPLAIPDGANGAGTLAIYFAADTDNGIYRVGTNQWDLVAGGTIVARIGASQFRIGSAGSASAPSLAMGVTDNLTGFYNPAVGSIGITSSGALVTTHSANGFISKGLALARQTTNTNATLTNGSYKCYVDTSSAPVTITLPATPQDGQTIIVKKITTDLNGMTIARNGNNLEGAASDITNSLTTRPSYQLGFATGTGWWIE